MEFHDALYSRRSVHSFTGRIVTKSKIHSMPIPIGEQDEPVTPERKTNRSCCYPYKKIAFSEV